MVMWAHDELRLPCWLDGMHVANWHACKCCTPCHATHAMHKKRCQLYPPPSTVSGGRANEAGRGISNQLAELLASS
jgi:hypothetical protein